MPVRPAEVADIGAVVALRRTMFEAMGSVLEPGWEQAYADWLRPRLGSPGVCAMLYEDDELGVCSGAMGLLADDMPGPRRAPRTLRISNVCTFEHARRRGFGQACFDAVLRWGRENGATRALLNATAEGRPLYEAVGFVDADCPEMRLHFAG